MLPVATRPSSSWTPTLAGRCSRRWVAARVAVVVGVGNNLTWLQGPWSRVVHREGLQMWRGWQQTGCDGMDGGHLEASCCGSHSAVCCPPACRASASACAPEPCLPSGPCPSQVKSYKYVGSQRQQQNGGGIVIREPTKAAAPAPKDIKGKVSGPASGRVPQVGGQPQGGRARHTLKRIGG